MLAAKASLAIRVDALGEESNTEMGINYRATLEARLRQIEEGHVSLTTQIYCQSKHQTFRQNGKN
jgi:RNA processing factor Prp31